MRINEITSRIYELRSTVDSLYKTLYRDILNKVDTVFYLHKEYSDYEDNMYNWLKSFSEKDDVLLITYRLNVVVDYASDNNSDVVELKDNISGFSSKVYTIPVSLIKLILEEFNK